jgi:hypothetical protein
MFRSQLFDHHQGFTVLVHLLLPSACNISYAYVAVCYLCVCKCGVLARMVSARVLNDHKLCIHAVHKLLVTFGDYLSHLSAVHIFPPIVTQTLSSPIIGEFSMYSQ